MKYMVSKHEDPTNHGFYDTPYIGPWDPCEILMFMWSFRPQFEPRFFGLVLEMMSSYECMVDGQWLIWWCLVGSLWPYSVFLHLVVLGG